MINNSVEEPREEAREEDNEKLPEARREFPLTAWAGALLLMAALFAVAAIVAFGSMGRTSPWAWAFSALGVFSLLGWFLGRRSTQTVRTDEYSKQRTLLGVNAFMSVLLLLVLLVGVNYLAARRHKTFDLTQNKTNSLSEQSQKALEKLAGPVTMYYVYSNRLGGANPEPSPAATSLLNAYKNASDKVKVEYVSADVDYAEFSRLDLGNSFTGFSPLLVIEGSGSTPPQPAANNATPATPPRQQVTNVDEQNVTSALMKLTDSKTATLYFLSGHGEFSLDGATPASTQPGMPPNAGGQSPISQVKTALEGQNYTLQSFSLLQGDGSVPDDAAAIIVAGPQVDLAAKEEKALIEYLNGNGRLVLLLSPRAKPMPGWKRVAKALGVEVLDGFVVDFEQNVQSPQQVLAPTDGNRHALLRGVPENVGVVFPGVLGLKAQAASEGKTVTPLYESSAQSALVKGGQFDQQTSGPFVLAAAVEPVAAQPAMPGAPPPPTPECTRAVVVGSADFIRDGAVDVFANNSFLLSAVNWTVGNDDLVTIPPKPPVNNTLEMPGRTRLFATLIGIFVMPVLALIIGTVVWWKRR